MGLIAHLGQGSADKNGFTTSTVNTTGANLLTLILADVDGTSGISDSKGNAWSSGPSHVGGFGGAWNSMYFAKNPAVGSAHSITVVATNKSPAVLFAAFDSSDTASPLDQKTSAAINFSSAGQPGSITPTSSGQLIISGCTENDGSAFSVDSGFTITNQVNLAANAHFGGALGYVIQANAAAVNPTWTEATANLTAATIASFKPGAGGTPAAVPTPQRSMSGVGR